MRTATLRNQANVYLKNRQGSPRSRKYRRYVILKMINDLFTVKSVPPHWQALNATHIHLLVNHWQKHKMKTSTIMNYMTIIRKFLTSIGNTAANIDNKSLGLIAQKPLFKAKTIALERWQKIDNPQAKLLLNLQGYFGLTFSEAIRLLPGVHVAEKNLWITREIAFNSHDRFIPIHTQEQRDIIEEFNKVTQNLQPLINVYGYRALCFIWQNALKEIRIPPKTSCRYLYAHYIQKELGHTLSKQELEKLLMSEMGVSSKATIWRYLTNQ